MRVLTEMNAFVLYCRHHAGTWEARVTGSEALDRPGHASYAARHAAMWTEMVEQAVNYFKVVTTPGDFSIAFEGEAPQRFPDTYDSKL